MIVKNIMTLVKFFFGSNPQKRFWRIILFCAMLLFMLSVNFGRNPKTGKFYFGFDPALKFQKIGKCKEIKK